MKKPRGIFQKYSYLWLTLGLFLFSLIGHWIFAWFAFVDEKVSKNEPIHVSEYIIETSRDTLENWQSEFLQLMWQVGGLALFLYLGSPQSREGDDRREAKIDALLDLVSKEQAKEIIKQINNKYPKE